VTWRDVDVRRPSGRGPRLGARAAFLVAILATARARASADASNLDQAARVPATRVELAPAADGSLGAFLVLGPFPVRARGSAAAPQGAPLEHPPPALGTIDDAALTPVAGAAVAGKSWTLASASEGPIDLKGALHASGNELVAYAAATLHVEEAGRYLLLLGADDGVRVFVDGKTAFARDESRPQRDDDDIVPLELGAGDHTLLLKLHQRDAGWAFKVRLLGAEHLDPPVGAYLALPGTTPADAAGLAGKLSWVSVDRGLGGAAGYGPRLTVRFPDGAPRGVPLTTSVKLAGRDRSSLIDVDVGEVPLDSRGARELAVILPRLDRADRPLEDADLTYEVTVAGRLVKAAFHPRRRIHDAVVHASAALSRAAGSPTELAPGSRDSVAYLTERLASLASHSDADVDAELADARELEDAAAAIDRHEDPYARRVGAMRRALVAPFDGKPAPFGLYVPASYRPGTARRYPLVVGLHGLNGRPMAMVRYLFGHDDPNRDNEWEDRHVGPLEPLDAFILTPHGYGNTMYRDLGEDDILRLLGWVVSHYSIDPDRVTITGMSMGGIGAASVPLKHPGIFAAAEPLCGYHSYFVRRDIAGHPLRPWEQHLAEERSNVFWAQNGQHLPLYVVHGTLDLPEENSGVLIRRYEELGYDIIHEHPPLGHNVWQTTYEDLKGVKWLLHHARDSHPAHVVFRTMRLRDGEDAWVHVDELARPDGWGEVDARVARGKPEIAVTTSGVVALHLDRDGQLGTGHGPVTVAIDGARLAFDDGVTDLAMHRDGVTAPWQPGPARHEAPYKHGPLTGPIRDAFHEPLLFVYGASDPGQSRANEEVARQWAAIRWGVTVEYPIMSDTEFLARGEPIANDRALFLVGNAKSNAVVAALDARLPIRVEGDAVLIAGERVTGREVGAAFICPNPARTDRYVVVVEGVDAPGTWRSLSLPDLLPDFVVYDAAVAPSRGQMILGSGSVRAAGFFSTSWQLPSVLRDPLADTARPAAKSEYEATPYLP
jgi:predicted esterase